jgi:RNA polymerase-associated protein RTF1
MRESEYVLQPMVHRSRSILFKSRGSPRRDRSSSPMEMETSDEEAEDGQITKFEQEEEKERKLLGMALTLDEPMTLGDLNKVRLTRDALAKHFLAPWFEDYVKGTATITLSGSCLMIAARSIRAISCGSG